MTASRNALALTAEGLIRALSGAPARPAVDRVLAGRADRLAALLGGPGRMVTVERRESGAAAPPAYVVTVAGPGLFSREFGTLGGAADPVVAPALATLKGER